MKRLLSSVLLLALGLMLLASCAPAENFGAKRNGGTGENPDVPEGDGGKEFFLIGEVTNITDRIEVNVIEGEYAYGIYHVLVSDEADIFDKDGGKITADGIKIGDTVKVIYGGQVMMSYPPQIAAFEVRVQ